MDYTLNYLVSARGVLQRTKIDFLEIDITKFDTETVYPSQMRTNKSKSETWHRWKGHGRSNFRRRARSWRNCPKYVGMRK